MFLGPADRPDRPRRVEVGGVADLCVLAEPLDAALTGHDDPVALATIVDGTVIHRAEP
jgi:predicted amidohydrolase YtcJ